MGKYSMVQLLKYDVDTEDFLHRDPLRLEQTIRLRGYGSTEFVAGLEGVGYLADLLTDGIEVFRASFSVRAPEYIQCSARYLQLYQGDATMPCPIPPEVDTTGNLRRLCQDGRYIYTEDNVVEYGHLLLNKETG